MVHSLSLNHQKTMRYSSTNSLCLTLLLLFSCVALNRAGCNAEKKCSGTGAKDISRFNQKFADNYLLGPVLGEGTFGIVFEAINKKTSRQVALKRVKGADPIFTSILQKEGIVNQLALPNVNIISCSMPLKFKEEVFLECELCDGSISSLLKSQQLPKKTFSFNHECLFHQLIQGLHHLHHEKRIAHRDLKPENLFYKVSTSSTQITLKIADFGSAIQLTTGETETAIRIQGTAKYLSPEILEIHRKARFNQGSSPDLRYNPFAQDIWAAAVTLLQFQNPSLIDSIFKAGGIVAQHEKLMGFLTEGKFNLFMEDVELFKGMLAKDPQRRLTTLDIVKAMGLEGECSSNKIFK